MRFEYYIQLTCTVNAVSPKIFRCQLLSEEFVATVN